MISPYVYVGMKEIYINPDEIKKELLINEFVAAHFRLNVEDLTIKTRKEKIVIPRQLAMYFIRENTGKYLKSIGEMFNGFDHTTVIHSLEQINNGIDTKEPKIYPHYLAIKHKISTSIINTNEQHSTNFSSTRGQGANFKRNQKKHSRHIL